MPNGQRRVAKLLFGSICLFFSVAADAQSWRSPLLGRELVIVEKTVPGDLQAPRSLPPGIRVKLGNDFVEYESFVAARLPAAAARELTTAALTEKRGVFRDTRPPAVLPFQIFHPEDTAERWTRWRGKGLPPTPVPDLFLIRFAFPLLGTWTEALRACGAEPILYYGNEMFLTRASNLGVIQSCAGAARYLAWADAFRVTDRTAPELLDKAGLDFTPWTLVFVPGTDLDTALAELPPHVETGGHRVWEDRTLSLAIRAGRPELEALARTSLHLMSILELEGEPQPSDERQGQIVAGNYVGYPGAVSGAVTAPGYLNWLNGRGLLSRQQTVAVFDTGFDNGTLAPQHPDLAGCLIAGNETEVLGSFVFNRGRPIDDIRGHGTFVAGILCSTGTTGKKDEQNFNLGLGIAPNVRLVPVQVVDSEANCSPRTAFGDPPDNIANAITFSRVTAAGTEKAAIFNHSWNLDRYTYTSMAKLFDERVIDGATSVSGNQPSVMVISAGNDGPGFGTILSPATSKNGITVGSSQSYRPSTEPGAPANLCALNADSRFNQETNNIGKVSAFSSRGADFRPYNLPVVPPLVTERRVKPDLVAGGERVFSTVPSKDVSPYYTCTAGLCDQYLPLGTSYSLGSGTSFAAPVVTGLVAHARTWFMDRGVLSPPPAPSLLKAALIATATDLGPAMGGDHRPSNSFGWGRVDLNRLTDPAVARFYVNERVEFAVSTGAEVDWQRTIDNPSRPTMIVLVWSDPASSASPTTSQVPLLNDLHLQAEMIGGNLYWRGNNFYENRNGNDNGLSYPFALGGEPFVNDTMNNVEAIFIPANTFWPGQKIIIRVSGVSVHGTAQRFALYGYNVRLGS